MDVLKFPILESSFKSSKKLDFEPSIHALFILIDDEPACMIGRINIKRAFRGSEVHTFSEPTEGLKYLYSLNDNVKDYEAIIALIDLDMPKMKSFDILDQLSNFRNRLPQELITYVLSSSIDTKAVERAIAYEITSGFICKPLTIERLIEVFGKSS